MIEQRARTLGTALAVALLPWAIFACERSSTGPNVESEGETPPPVPATAWASADSLVWS
jgi:hypothetical protein